MDQSFYMHPQQARALTQKRLVNYWMLYDQYMKDVMAVIRRAAENGHHEIRYQIRPMIATGILPVEYVMAFVVRQLRAIRYTVTVQKDNIILINWLDDSISLLPPVPEIHASAPPPPVTATAAAAAAAKPRGRGRPRKTDTNASNVIRL